MSPTVHAEPKILTPIEALTLISQIAGNLSDERIAKQTSGPNSAQHWALAVINARAIARQALWDAAD